MGSEVCALFCEYLFAMNAERWPASVKLVAFVVLCASQCCAVAGTASFGECGVKGSASPRIVNGEDAVACEHRWQANLITRRSKISFCGGTLISENYVLTAAHCVEQTGEGALLVRLGDYQLSAEEEYQEDYMVAEINIHPRYMTSTNHYDFALLRLQNNVSLNACVGFACLPDEAIGNKAVECVISGWGTLSSGGSSPDTLQEASVTTLSQDDCEDKYGDSGSITGSMLCAQGQKPRGPIIDACQGDSGGPLVCEISGSWVVHGVTSWGSGCAERRYPGVWARVYEAIPWISRIMLASDRRLSTRDVLV